MRLIDADELRWYFMTIPPDYYSTDYIMAVIDDMPTIERTDESDDNNNTRDPEHH